MKKESHRRVSLPKKNKKIRLPTRECERWKLSKSQSRRVQSEGMTYWFVLWCKTKQMNAEIRWRTYWMGILYRSGKWKIEASNHICFWSSRFLISWNWRSQIKSHQVCRWVHSSVRNTVEGKKDHIQCKWTHPRSSLNGKYCLESVEILRISVLISVLLAKTLVIILSFFKFYKTYWQIKKNNIAKSPV